MIVPAWSIATAFGAGVVGLVAWNLAQGVRITALPGAGRGLRTLSGLGAFLLPPALVIGLLAPTVPGARVLGPLTWLVPLVTLGIAVQSVWSLARGRGGAVVAGLLSLYNVFVAWVAVARFVDGTGIALPGWALAPGLAVSSLVAAAAGDRVFTWGATLAIPALAPAAPARRAVTSAARVLLSAACVAVLAACAAAMPHAYSELAAVQRLDRSPAELILRGTPAIGLHLFGTVTGEPSPSTARRDMELADSLGVSAVHIVLASDGVTTATLDSLARLIEARRDSVTLVVTLLLEGAIPSAGTRRDAARMTRLEQIARRLRPNVLLPADRVTGTDVGAWQAYYGRAAAAVHRIDRGVAVALATECSTPTDSALVDWVLSGSVAASAVAFVARDYGARPVQTLRALDALARWVALAREPARVWIVGVPTAPAVFGERAQQRVVRRVLAWSAARPWVRGVIAGDASDIAAPTALRTASGRSRLALHDVGAALRAQSDSLRSPFP
ncbi:MAG: hypothetical protein HYV19_06350 [Gemmatimonadetes bacterium]|nr:hypothetical protein [Gemmatimonadota bacterium]